MEYKSNGVRDNHLNAFEAFKRQYIYEQWTRRNLIGLYVGNIDQIFFQTKDNTEEVVAIFELTTSKYQVFDGIPESYLLGMKRRFEKGKEALITSKLASLLNVPAYIVFYPVDTSSFENYTPQWFYVYSFIRKSWKYFTEEQWLDFIRKLKK